MKIRTWLAAVGTLGFLAIIANRGDNEPRGYSNAFELTSLAAEPSHPPSNAKGGSREGRAGQGRAAKLVADSLEQASVTDASLKRMEDTLREKISTLRAKKYAKSHLSPMPEGEDLGPIHSMREEAKLHRELKEERERLAGHPSQQQSEEEKHLADEVERQREKLASAVASSGRGSAYSAANKKVPKETKEQRLKAAEAKDSLEARNLYYRAMKRFWISNNNAQFGDWRLALSRWDDGLGLAVAAAGTAEREVAKSGKGKTTEASEKSERAGGARSRKGEYAKGFAASFSREMRRVGADTAGDTVSRALYLSAERAYFEGHPAAGREDWREVRHGFDASAPPAMLSWKEGSQTALYSQEADDLFEKAREQEAAAREAYYAAQEAYWKAEHRTGFEEWKRSQQEWDYWYSNPYVRAPKHGAATPTKAARPVRDAAAGAGTGGHHAAGGGVAGDTGGYRSKFLALYRDEVTASDHEGPSGSYLAKSLYLYAEQCYFGAKPKASQGDWEKAKGGWDAFYSEDKALDERQRMVDAQRARAVSRAGVTTQRKGGASLGDRGVFEKLLMGVGEGESEAEKESWDDFTAIPPSRRPGLGMARGAQEVDAIARDEGWEEEVLRKAQERRGAEVAPVKKVVKAEGGEGGLKTTLGRDLAAWEERKAAVDHDISALVSRSRAKMQATEKEEREEETVVGRLLLLKSQVDGAERAREAEERRVVDDEQAQRRGRGGVDAIPNVAAKLPVAERTQEGARKVVEDDAHVKARGGLAKHGGVKDGKIGVGGGPPGDGYWTSKKSKAVSKKNRPAPSERVARPMKRVRVTRYVVAWEPWKRCGHGKTGMNGWVRDAGDLCAVLSAIRDAGSDGLGDASAVTFTAHAVKAEAPAPACTHALRRLNREQARINRGRFELYVKSVADEMLSMVGLSAGKAELAGDDALATYERTMGADKGDWRAVTRMWDELGEEVDGVLELTRAGEDAAKHAAAPRRAAPVREEAHRGAPRGVKTAVAPWGLGGAEGVAGWGTEKVERALRREEKGLEEVARSLY